LGRIEEANTALKTTTQNGGKREGRDRHEKKRYGLTVAKKKDYIAQAE